jgi:Leucine-rich repeat (LRR) protein
MISPIDITSSSLVCSGFDLDDIRVSQILNAFLSLGIDAPITTLSLDSNQLTRVPDQIRLFSKLGYLNLNNNLITTVTTGSFNIAVPFELVLQYNPTLAIIEAGAFQGER